MPAAYRRGLRTRCEGVAGLDFGNDNVPDVDNTIAIDVRAEIAAGDWLTAEGFDVVHISVINRPISTDVSLQHANLE